MKVILICLLLQATLPAYLALDSAGNINPGRPESSLLGSYDQFQASRPSSVATALNGNYDMLPEFPLTTTDNRGRHVAAAGVTRQDLNRMSRADLKHIFGVSKVEDVRFIQPDGSSKKVGGRIRKIWRKIKGFFLATIPLR
ncbi:hypothetical protein H4R35_001161 [Dimargaris xerosporica]|nr:hypothetical protein H4R35_001161 [Dimargaris xerosporica]